MKEFRFLMKFVMFSVPIVVILGFPLLVMWRSGEFLSDDQMVAHAVAYPTSTLVGLTFSNPVYYLQLHATIAKDPQVLVLGSSRVQQIRSDFFNNPSDVYIASGAVQKISYFRDFLEKIPNSQSPKVLIIGLDQKFFNPSYDSLAPDDIDDLLTQPDSFMDVAANWVSVYRYYAEGRFSLGEVAHASSYMIGLWAIADGSGYRGDGSHAPGYEIYTADDPTFSDIENGLDGFEPAAAISGPALQELDAFLALCKSRNIYVVGFIPPFSPAAYEKLTSLPSRFGYLPALSPDIAPLFNKYGFDFYNFTDPQSLDLASSDMQDGIHLTERGSLILFQKIVATDHVLQQYADPSALEKQLQATDREINLFEATSSI